MRWSRVRCGSGSRPRAWCASDGTSPTGSVRRRLVAPGADGRERRLGDRATGSASKSGAVTGEIRAAGDGLVVLRLAARTAQAGLATGDFATPAVGVALHAASTRDDGGAPEGLRAFGHQYTEFALPVFSDAALSRWRLLPFRPAGRHAARSGRARRAHDPARSAATRSTSRSIGVPAGKEQAGAGSAGGLARRHRRRRGRVRDRARGDRGRRRARLLRALGRALARGVGSRGAGTRLRRARHPVVVLDRQRQRVLVPHRTRARPRVDRRRRGRRPRGARRARRRGAARLLVVPARGVAPVRHRRVGRAAVGHGALGAACRRAARRHRRAARATRPPPAGRALPSPLVAVAVRRRVRDVDRRRPRAPAGPRALRTPPRPGRRRGASRCSSTTG